MSDRDFTLRLGRRTLGRRAVSLLAAAAGLVLIGGGGSLLGAQSATTASNRVALVGRTTYVCTVSKDHDSRVSVGAVAVRREPERQGELRAEPLSGGKAELEITEQGKGKIYAEPDGTVLVSAGGVMATGASAAVLGSATTGDQAGLMAAPCSPPTTLHWFPGVGTSDTDKTQLILTNPDDAQAVVDLRFFGRRGRVAVPGSPGIAVRGHSTRTISISALVQTDGPLSVAIRTSSGRVAAVARDLRRYKQEPAGADWQLGAAAPATSAVIPAIPDGDGVRRLVVTNPGTSRAAVTISALGIQGAFAPAGAESLYRAGEYGGSRPHGWSGGRAGRNQADQRPAGHRSGALHRATGLGSGRRGNTVGRDAARPRWSERHRDRERNRQRLDPDQRIRRRHAGHLRGVQLCRRQPEDWRRTTDREYDCCPPPHLGSAVVRGGAGPARSGIMAASGSSSPRVMWRAGNHPADLTGRGQRAPVPVPDPGVAR